MLKEPICVIGAARSGTTLLSRLLSRHSEIAFWTEPKYLWQYGNPATPHDRRTADEATPNVRNYIRAELEEYVKQNGATRLAEKTPSNCFRVPFVYAVLPNARFVHVIRDGRDVAFSAWEQWRIVNGEGKDRYGNEARNPLRKVLQHGWNRVRANDIPLAELPFYAVKFAKKIARNAGFGGTDGVVNTWGPKFPGIQETAGTHGHLETCAIQWRKSVRSAYNGFQSVPGEQQLEIRFEHLVQNPTDVMQTIFDFADLEESEAVMRWAEENVRSDVAHRWKDRDADAVQRVMDEAGDLVRELETSL
jgi:LPS sulfotransferase NodH